MCLGILMEGKDATNLIINSISMSNLMRMLDIIEKQQSVHMVFHP